MSDQFFDVVAVDMSTGAVSVIEKGKSQTDADAIVYMAVKRRGVEEEFFVSVESGKYKDGDYWGDK